MDQPSNTNGNRVIVGLSGGVDSAVAAMLLKQNGYSVEGLFMKNWDEDDDKEYCTAQKDLEDAKDVAVQLDIPLHQANFAAEYWDNVFKNFLAEYEAGRTPNPDVLCNREIKFKVFQDYAKSLGANFIATGHYARLDKSRKEIRLLKAHDRNKDQTYFLQAVNASQLTNVIFPLGDISKDHVRILAKDKKLKIYNKKDSTGICFIGERRFRDFLKSYLPAQPGRIEDSFGNIIGQHEGLMFHTIGQRQGLQIGGVRGGNDEPWYVLRKEVARNALIVGQGNDHQGMYSSSAFCKKIYWIGSAPTLPFSGTAKIRYRQEDQKCSLIARGSGFQVDFHSPQRAVTPGQWVCFYDHEQCLGGGIIE